MLPGVQVLLLILLLVRVVVVVRVISRPRKMGGNPALAGPQQDDFLVSDDGRAIDEAVLMR